MLNNAATQGCVFSPHLFLLYTHGCNPRRSRKVRTWFQTTTRLHIRRRLTVLHIAAQKTSHCATSAKPRSWLLIFGKGGWGWFCSWDDGEGKISVPMLTSTEEQVKASWLETSQSGMGRAQPQDRQTLQWVIKTTQNIIGARLLNISDNRERRCLCRTQRILKGKIHSSHSLFTLLPSERRWRNILRCTTRLKSSFFPQAVRLLNAPSALLHVKLFYLF